MTPTRSINAELDDLIAEMTVDAYDEDEQLSGIACVIEEDAHFPCPGTLIGRDIKVLGVHQHNQRRELIATCQHDGKTYEVALLDIQINADPDTTRLVAAYRRWADA